MSRVQILSHMTPSDVHPFGDIRENMAHQLRSTITRLQEFREKVKPGNFKIHESHRSTDKNATYFRFLDQAVSQAERALRIRNVCQRQERQLSEGEQPGTTPYHTGWYDKDELYNSLEVYYQQRVLFCPVLKVGSTFWRRLWNALEHGKQVASPYDIPIAKALAAKRTHLKDVATGFINKHSPLRRRGDLHPRQPWPGGENMNYTTVAVTLNDSAVEEFIHKAGTVMFTREPYAKLLSGYVDKLFAPNPFFWSAIGKHIIQNVRPDASPKSLECGHDVTFPEFIKFVLESERTGKFKRDKHFVSSFDQCKPCNITYDIVGKMETFPQDAGLVLAQLGFNLSQSTLAEWGRLSENDAIEDSITSPYSWRKAIVKCMTWEEANRRIWRKMQIRGLVDRRQPLPMTSYKQYSLRSKDFTQVVKNVWQAFRTTDRKSAQKKAAMSSAYSLVPKADLEKLREYFLIDFDVFGYDSRPDVVFSAESTWDVFN
ncbi:hypothetical protein BaRGS_00037523, partial [Batillaria attramentaria]